MARTKNSPAEAPLRGGIPAWRLLAIGMFAASAAGAFATRGSGVVNAVSIAVMILTVGLVVAAAARTLAPLASDETGERADMLAGRTRAALEREKMLVLRSIKETEFDRAMRKISDADYQEMVSRLRARAVGLIRQIEGGGGYRALIERDLAALVGTGSPAAVPAPAAPTVGTSQAAPADAAAAPDGGCLRCGTVNDRDARFCKTCGTPVMRDV